jgi:hypothetical protein
LPPNDEQSLPGQDRSREEARGKEGMTAQLTPVAVRATATWKTRRWLKSRYRSIRYDVRFADGREEHGVDLNAVLQGARFPADYRSTRDGAAHVCPEEGTGPWVDYPYGRPL